MQRVNGAGTWTTFNDEMMQNADFETYYKVSMDGTQELCFGLAVVGAVWRTVEVPWQMCWG